MLASRVLHSLHRDLSNVREGYCNLFIPCTTIHRHPIFSTRYSVICKVYTGFDTSEKEHGSCACTVHNYLSVRAHKPCSISHFVASMFISISKPQCTNIIETKIKVSGPLYHCKVSLDNFRCSFEMIFCRMHWSNIGPEICG